MLRVVDGLEREAPGARKESLKGLEAMEREHILKVLKETRWKINGVGGAASVLELHPNTLRSRIKKLDIKRP